MSKKTQGRRAELVAALREKHGDGVFLRSSAKPADVDVIPTGSFEFDRALGIGGWARGRIAEIWGPEATCKTTLTLHACANAQRMGLGAAFVDLEHALDTRYATAVGVDVAELTIVQPDNAEQALTIVEELVGTGEFAVVVLDSVAALVAKKEIEGETGEAEMGVRARLMGQHIRKVTPRAFKTNTLLLYLNQVRQKIGVMYGNPNTTTGGNALKYFASQRVSVSRPSDGKIMDGKPARQIGAKNRATVVKNKFAPPFVEADFDVIFGKGIDRIADMRDAALGIGVLLQSGGWISQVDPTTGECVRVAHGRNALRDRLADDVEFRAVIVAELGKRGLRWVE